MSRREFRKSVKAQIVHRAMDADGLIVCEGCGLVLGKKPYDIDHTTPDALVLDKSAPLTAEDGKLLGRACCHRPKTTQEDIPNIARAKRREAKHLGFGKRSTLTHPKLKRLMDGTVVDRRTGQEISR